MQISNRSVCFVEPQLPNLTLKVGSGEESWSGINQLHISNLFYDSASSSSTLILGGLKLFGWTLAFGVELCQTDLKYRILKESRLVAKHTIILLFFKQHIIPG